MKPAIGCTLPRSGKQRPCLQRRAQMPGGEFVLAIAELLALRPLARGGREASFVRMIIELARTLGVTVIAEGIEEHDQAVALVALECDLGQGFYLGLPQPVRRELPLLAVA